MPHRVEEDLTLPGLVHDLLNVFQTLYDAADLLSEDARWNWLSATIRRSAEHGERLTRGISESARDTFSFEEIAAIAIQFARDFLNAKRGREIDFHLDIPQGFGIGGSAISWERILVNLILNAAQAMPGGGQVRISASTSALGAEIRIDDNGPGIPDDVLPRVFEPRFSTRRSNSGLGLHIVRSMVHLNGGTVTAHNRPEGGAGFVILVPPQDAILTADEKS
ncbi:MAG: HAMP domain-containing histidine kinase [Candidatus Solibacter usitatus]|nr:HAMP domain-containing histidine kinase [Candidatus Solibacter usitatus]